MKKYTLEALSPVTTYSSPAVPTFEERKVNGEVLKKLPRRWQNSSAVLATLGLAAAIVFSGCTRPVLEEQEVLVASPQDQQGRTLTYNGRNFTVRSRSHHGGSGASPIYTLHFTEQEILGFIREKLAVEGINLQSDNLPGFRVPGIRSGGDFSTNPPSIRIRLFDHQNDVGIALVDRWGASRVASDFAQQNNSFVLGLFNEHAESVRSYNISQETLSEMYPIFVEDLTMQVEEFIRVLRGQGIID